MTTIRTTTTTMGVTTTTTTSTTLNSSANTSTNTNFNNTIDIIKIYCNLQCINGIRCIVSYCVILFHVHYLWGSLLLRESTCLHTVSNFGMNSKTFLGTLLFDRITFHMTLFWIISGFLCEYQLHQIVLNKNKLQQQKQDHNLSTNTNTDTTSTSITWYECIKFIYNRLVRLYPLYILFPILTHLLLTYHTKPLPIVNSNNQYSVQDILSYTLYDLFLTLIFSKQWTLSSLITPATSWSVQVDVHGYIALLVLFLLSYKNVYCTVQQQQEKQQSVIPFSLSSFVYNICIPYKRLVLLLLYIGSIVSVIYIYKPLDMQYHNITDELFTSIIQYGFVGIETVSDPALLILGYGGTTGRSKMYPYIDFTNSTSTGSTVQQLNKYCTYMANNTYFASIFNHGSAVFLGSLLYINCYKRYTKQHNNNSSNQNMNNTNYNYNSTHFWCIIKLVLSYIVLSITHGWYTTSGVAMYFFLDSILSMKSISTTNTAIERNTTSKTTSTDTTNTTSSNIIQFVQESVLYPICNSICYCIVSFLSLPIFTLLAPYTYSIYLFHIVFIAIRQGAVVVVRVDAIINGNSNINSTTTTNLMDLACQSLNDAGHPYTIQFVIYESMITFICALVLSIILHHVIEKPLTNYLRKIMRERKIERTSSGTTVSKKVN